MTLLLPCVKQDKSSTLFYTFLQHPLLLFYFSYRCGPGDYPFVSSPHRGRTRVSAGDSTASVLGKCLIGPCPIHFTGRSLPRNIPSSVRRMPQRRRFSREEDFYPLSKPIILIVVIHSFRVSLVNTPGTVRLSRLNAVFLCTGASSRTPYRVGATRARISC